MEHNGMQNLSFEDEITLKLVSEVESVKKEAFVELFERLLEGELKNTELKCKLLDYVIGMLKNFHNNQLEEFQLATLIQLIKRNPDITVNLRESLAMYFIFRNILSPGPAAILQQQNLNVLNTVRTMNEGLFAVETPPIYKFDQHQKFDVLLTLIYACLENNQNAQVMKQVAVLTQRLCVLKGTSDQHISHLLAILILCLQTGDVSIITEALSKFVRLLENSSVSGHQIIQSGICVWLSELLIIDDNKLRCQLLLYIAFCQENNMIDEARIVNFLSKCRMILISTDDRVRFAGFAVLYQLAQRKELYVNLFHEYDLVNVIWHESTLPGKVSVSTEDATQTILLIIHHSNDDEITKMAQDGRINDLQSICDRENDEPDLQLEIQNAINFLIAAMPE